MHGTSNLLAPSCVLPRKVKPRRCTAGRPSQARAGQGWAGQDRAGQEKSDGKAEAEAGQAGAITREAARQLQGRDYSFWGFGKARDD